MTKRLLLILSLNFLLTALSFGAQPVPGKFKIVTDGKSDFRIVLPADPDSVELRSAEQLQKYFSKISGAVLPVEREPVSFKDEILIGRTRETEKLLSAKTLDSLDPDGYLLRTVGTKLIICGGTRKGTLYGVYSLLEDFLGCRKYTATVTVIPPSSSIFLPQLHRLFNPFFQYRQVYYLDTQNQDYDDWQKLYSPADQHKMWGMWVHTFAKLIPPSKYFDEHPDYFSEINGQRVPNGQLCLSNPHVLPLLVRNLKKMMAENPGAQYWSVSQNDNTNESQDDSSKALDERYGGPSGTIVNFVNHVAAEFPDKTISTLAYQYTRAAPTHIRPAKNVNIMLCSIECNRSEPISTDPRSESFRRDMENWTKLTHNIIMWDYVVQFSNLVSPFPNFRVLQPNIRYFERNGIRMVFEQGCGDNVGEFCHLRAYILAKLLWNPNINVDSVMTDFLDGYYGAGGPYLHRYISMMEDALAKSGKGLNIYGSPYDALDSYLTPSLIKKYSQLFDEAERAVAKRPAFLRRVKIARLPLEFAILDISMRHPTPQLSYFVRHGGHWTVRRSMVKLLNSFVAEAEKAGIKLLQEHGMSPEEYKESVEQFMHLSIKGNLAYKKPVKMLTEYSNEYPVGGGAALTDGFHGPDNYDCNWLGFQGDNCVAVVDLKSVKRVDRIETSWLQDWYAWIWLPLKVKFSVSTDGKNFMPVGELPDTVPDTTNGAFVKAFDVNFPAVKARYIKVDAISRKVCPNWHLGAGQKSWIFIDEIVVK